ncbi:MAG: ribosome maturation factor RimM [Clostridiales bacterium]|nr:ribosome maturation factor RimM [Clostridiales bacterium]
MIEYFDIGKIVNVHGIKGEVKIYPYTDYVEVFESLSYLIIDKKEMKISNARIHKKMVLVQFEDIINRSQAEKHINKIVYIHRKDGHQLSTNEYYLNDLMGCKVLEDNRHLGTIVDIVHTGSNDVYIVRDKENEILIPALKTVILKVDIANKEIIVKLPEGLLEDE